MIFNRDLVSHINSLKTTWKARPTPYMRFANRTVAEIKLTMGTRMDKPITLPWRVYNDSGVAPDDFDSRKQWPNCPTIGEIRDQSECGSCWAFGAIEAISDRFCIALSGTDAKYKKVEISGLDMTGCCGNCGYGCQGGYPQAAWQYWYDTGLTTESCDAYPYPKCEHHIPEKHYPKCPHTLYPTPACPTQCHDGTPWAQATRYFAKQVYGVQGGVASYQAELQKNGPFEVMFQVYADFLQYTTGVYKHQSGGYLGGHAVKILGWGVDNGTPYWTIANSWNEDWGEGGTFRILRGSNECGLEGGAVGGDPKPLA